MVTERELINMFSGVDKMNIKLKELKYELDVLDCFTGVKSAKLDQMVVGGSAKSLVDIIIEKDNLKYRICKLEIKINRFVLALDVLNHLERDILFMMYGKYRIPIKSIVGTKKVNYYGRSKIYQIRNEAINKMLTYMNSDYFE